MRRNNLKALIALGFVLLCAGAAAAQTTTSLKICANKTTGAITARKVCGTAETQLIFPQNKTGLLVSSCLKTFATGNSASTTNGSASAAIQCDGSTEFLMNWGFVSDNAAANAALTRARLTYPSTTAKLPNGVAITTVTATTQAYSIVLTGTCCPK